MYTPSLKNQIVINGNLMPQYIPSTTTLAVSSSNYLHVCKYNAYCAIYHVLTLDIIPHTTSASHLPHTSKIVSLLVVS